MKSSRILYRAVIETLESRRLLSLAAPVSYAPGSGVTAMATGDFNGDGRSDVVIANLNGPDGNHVSVLLSNANGTLQPAQQFATGINPNSVAVGDVNGDGKRDIVTTNYGGDLSVLLGNGNGTFQAPLSVTLPPQAPAHPGATTSSAPQTPQSVVVGDLNADGKLDLCVGAAITFAVPYYGYFGLYDRWYSQGHVNTLLGNGDGTFGTARTVTLGAAAPSVALGDFNNDTKPDVQFASGGSPGVLLGNGDGSLQTPTFAGAYGTKVTSGDFDMDGKRDLVVGEGTTFKFLKGQGNGAFVPQGDIAVFGTARSVVAGDMDGDGKLDLVACTTKTTFESYGYYGGYNPTTTDYTKVLLGHGDGTFSRGVSSTTAAYPGQGYASPANASALVDFNGDSRPDLVAVDAGNLSVQLNQPGWIVPGTLTIGDAPPVTEGNSGTVNAVFTVTLAEAPAANVTVRYDVRDNGATLEGGDYVAGSGTLTFAPGETTKTITVQIRGDRVGEYEEGYIVALSNATNADIIRHQGFGTIADDEPHVISFTGGTVVESNTGTVPLTFTVGLSAPSDAPVTVSYGTVDYYAVSATDFVPVTGTLTFAPGETTRTFAVQVKGDLVPEYDEQLLVNLTGSTNSLIAVTPQAAGTITDTDPNPSISIADLSRAEGNSGQTGFEFVVSLSGRSEKHISAGFATASGTATSSGGNRDFRSASGFVDFYPGQTTARVYVVIIGDTRNESDETFFVNLSSPFDATIADAQAVGTILNDESRGKHWIGPASGGSWSTAANWSPSGVPVASSLVTIANSSVTLPSGASVAELYLRDGATLAVAENGGRVLRVPGLYLDGDANLNLNDNALILDYAGTTPMTDVTAWLAAGRGAPAGIYSPQANASAGGRALGVAEAADALALTGAQTAPFAGQTVDATTVLVRYTLAADSNLDRAVSFPDLLTLGRNYNRTGATFAQGDFDYDGVVGFSDLLTLAKSYNQALPAALPGPGPAAAPTVLHDDAVPQPVFSVLAMAIPVPAKRMVAAQLRLR